MKNLSLILSGIACIGVAVLFFMKFNGTSASPIKAEGRADAEVAAGGIPVAYINSDSLLANYKLLDEMRKALEDKKSNAEKQLQGRGAKLEEEMGSFQRRAQAGLLSNNELKTGQESLLQKRDALLSYEKQLTAGLMEEEKLMNNRLYDSLMSYLKDYNKDNRYKYIFNYTKGGAFFMADDNLDITNEVVKGMNQRYEIKK